MNIRNIFSGKQKEPEQATEQDLPQKVTMDTVQGKKTYSREDLKDAVNSIIQGFEHFGLGNKMADDILSDKDLKIHEEKSRCKKAYAENSFIQTGVNNLLSVLLGANPKINADNSTLRDFASKWERMSNFKNARSKALKQAVISGDGYIRKIKGENGNYKYQPIENAEDVYIEWDYKNNRPLRYIERLYYSQGKARQLGIQEWTLIMPWGQEKIQGIAYNPEEIIHFQFMEGRFGIYGRSPIASVLNDIKVINKMERSIAIISVFKAIPRKILFPKQSSSEDDNMSESAVQKVINSLKQVKDFESPVVGTAMDSLNLTDSGQAIDLTGYLDYFKRKISVVLNPEYIIHGELVNRNTGSEQKQIFYLSVISLRAEFEEPLERGIEEGLNNQISILEKQGISIPRGMFWFEWGKYDVELREEKNERIQKEWLDGTIKLNEYRREMEYPEDEELGEFYRWELTGNMEAQVGESIKQLANKDQEEKNEKVSQDQTEK